MQIENHIPPPKLRKHTRRMTDAIRGMKPGESALVDLKTARCVKAYGRNHGWQTSMRAEGNLTRIWRVA